MGSLPAFDTRPNDPLFGPLSMWLLGDNPFDPEDRPATFEDLAERLGVEPSKLRQKRHSRRFRDFHNEHTGSLNEIVERQQALLNRLYEMGMEGNVSAATLYFRHTAGATALANAARDLSELTPEEAAQLTDEELTKLLGDDQG